MSNINGSIPDQHSNTNHPLSNKIRIDIINIKRINTSESSLKALVDFRLNDSEFYDFRIIQQKDQKAFVVPCAKEWTDGEGKKKFKPLIKFPKNLMDLISSELLKAYLPNNDTGGQNGNE